MSTWDAATEQIAAQWASSASTTLAWQKARNQAGAAQGESNGYFVTSPGLPRRRAYLKPRRTDESYRRAAREKIVADLAHSLGLPVPPAQLFLRKPSQRKKEERAVVLSLVTFPRQASWAQTRAGYERDEATRGRLKPVFEAASPMIAFNTWVDQTDHDDHPNNIILGWDPGFAPQLVFLDYSLSLGLRRVAGAPAGWAAFTPAGPSPGSDPSLEDPWANETGGNVVHSPFPRLLLENVKLAPLLATIDRIERIPEDVVSGIVARVPETHLTDRQKDVILKGLLGRRVGVRRALGALIEKATPPDGKAER